MISQGMMGAKRWDIWDIQNCQRKGAVCAGARLIGTVGSNGSDGSDKSDGSNRSMGLMSQIGQGIVVRPARKLQRRWWDARFDGGSGVSKEHREEGGW